VNTFGNHIRITFSGTSHGPEIGVVIEGLPAGVKLDETLIREGLDRRRPQSALATSRREPDRYEIRSGYADERTDGTPLAFAIRNEDVLSADYASLVGKPRPGHADYPAYVKSAGTADLRGGGMHSGRLTSLFMIAGAIAKQILNRHGIRVGSHILSVGPVRDASFDPMTVDDLLLAHLETLVFPVVDPSVEEPMKDVVAQAKRRFDSVGGIIETAVVGLPAGTGDPLFRSLESQLSALLFAVPAVKGVEFGDGFAFAAKTGAEVRDEYRYASDGAVRTFANHNGGIVGGMATGMPVICRAVVKPTASIAIPQRTIDLLKRENATIEIHGRHDPAIVIRAVHVVNAAVYFALLDLLAEDKPEDWFR